MFQLLNPDNTVAYTYPTLYEALYVANILYGYSGVSFKVSEVPGVCPSVPSVLNLDSQTPTPQTPPKES